jgi:hypothetical protein
LSAPNAAPLPCLGTVPVKSRRLLMLAILVWAAAARGGSLIGPFGSGWQHLGAGFTIIARNYLRYGLASTRGAMVVNPEATTPDHFVHFTHHPPGMAMTTAALMTVVGDGPLAIKLLGLAFSLLEIVVICALVTRAISPVAGLVAAFVVAVLPAGAYFATHGSELGPQAISLALLTILLDERARERDPQRPRSGAVLAAATASLFFEWLVFPVVVAIGLRDLLGRRRRRAALFLAFPAVAIGLHVLHMRWATGTFAGDRGGSLYDSIMSHGFLGMKLLAEELGGERLLEHVLRHARFLFTAAGLAIAALGLVVVLVRALRRTELRARFAGPFWMTLVLGLGYTLPFPRGVVVHRYWLTILFPWLALLIGAAVDFTWRWRPLRVVATAGLLLIGVLSTRNVVALQASARTPFFEELGAVLRARTPPDNRIFTTENFSEPLLYYSERSLLSDFNDATLASAKNRDGAAPVSAAWFALVQPSFDPPDVHCEKLKAYLQLHYECSTIPLPRSNRTLLLFDLSRRAGGDGGR